MLLEIALTLGTFHSVGGLNDFNPGAIASVQEVAKCAPTAGAYWNSERAVSMVFGCKVTRDLGAGFSASVSMLGITGYRAMAVTPAVLPSLSYRGLNATFLPPPKWVGAQSGVYGVNFSYSIALDLK